MAFKMKGHSLPGPNQKKGAPSKSNSATPRGKDHDKKHSEGYWEKEENKGTHPKHEKGNKRARVDKILKEKGIGIIPQDKKKGAPKLKGNQHKIDKNKDGKISKADFNMMNK